MPKKKALAKLTQPRLGGLFERERLFQSLDHHEDCPVTWIAGPGGSGKTALAASYLAARGLPSLWYRVDAEDKEPASLLDYLGQGLEQLKKRKPRLPQFGPEYLADLDSFARRYFRVFFQEFPDSAILVLDDCHQAEATLFHSLLAAAFCEVPAGVRILVLSRTEPPAEMSRLVANRSLAMIGAEQLEFSLDESLLLANDYGINRDGVESIQQASQGWAAGLILMMVAEKRHKECKRDCTPPDLRQPVFAYLAEEVFKRVPETVQNFWLRTALFPHMTVAMAKAASPDADAEWILFESNRRHFFTNMLPQATPVFQYHDLFREFLVAKARETLSPGDWATLRLTAGALLEQNDQIDAAVHWHLESGNWQAITRIILKHAPSLSLKGHTQTLLGWIAVLPETEMHSTPWLPFWKGACLLYMEPAQARALLSECLAEFRKEGNTVGAMVSAATFIESHMLDWGNDATVLDPWMTALEEAISLESSLPLPIDMDMRIVASLGLALLVRKPQSPLLPGLMRRMRAFLEMEACPNLRTNIASFVFTYHLWCGKHDKAGESIGHMEQLIGKQGVRPLARAFHDGVFLSSHHASTGDLKGAQQDALRGLTLASSQGLSFMEVKLLIHQALPCLLEGKLHEARKLLNTIERKLAGAVNLENVMLCHLRVTLELSSGNPERAMEYATTCRDMAAKVGVVVSEAWGNVLLGQCAIELKLPEQALAHLARARAIFEGMDSRIGMHVVALCESDAHCLAGNSAQSKRLLEQGLEIGQQENYMIHQWWHPQQMSRLCERAFRENIETDYLRSLVKLRQLAPPSSEVEEWPWSLRIYTLGRFAMLKDGIPLEFGNKAKHKQLELLKVLLALGGRNVASEKLAEILWPDAEADAALSTLGSTLHRLRKMLNDDNAITLEKGVLTLNPQRVWVDVWAFERAANKTSNACKKNLESQLTDDSQLLLRLYQGRFLEKESGAVWLRKMRDKLESRFLSALIELGVESEKQNLWRLAAGIYKSGLERASLSEELHRRLMQCHTRLGQKAEALSIYDRCREMLHESFQTLPSRETEALRAKLC